MEPNGGYRSHTSRHARRDARDHRRNRRHTTHTSTKTAIKPTMAIPETTVSNMIPPIPDC